jgi:hexosaminidase
MKHIFFSFLLLFCAFSAVAQSVIPQPVQLVRKNAGDFIVDKSNTILLVQDDRTRKIADVFNVFLQQYYGISLPIYDNSLLPIYTSAIILNIKEDAKFENYQLISEPNKLIINGDGAGVFYGLQSCLQLMTKKGENYVIPALELSDAPRFGWRGMHLDVCRHFFPVESIKKYIDALAAFKMNTFHWHLTEDQGWRIEIKKYPKLTEIGSKRKETIVDKNFKPYKGDGKPYGGFYTQDEIKEVVQYAADRFITIVPEIEMPGHALGALSAYPEYSCREKPLEVATEWGVFDDIYCTKEETFLFLEDILTEVCELFPGTYFHIGGDEAPKTRWKTCPKCQKRMKEQGLKTEEELQSYFVRRIEGFLAKKGKRLIGWDEILEGGIAPAATIMSWRGTDGGIAAAKEGHDAIMTPGSHCYFDHYQGEATYEPLAIGGFTPLEKIYSYEPIPQILTEEEGKHILGAQGNVWTEYMPDFERVEYMAFPRVLALAEVLWSEKKQRNWDNFQTRLPKGLEILDMQKIHYHVPTPLGLQQIVVSNETQKIELSANVKDAKIYYTLNGDLPTEKSFLYEKPIELKLKVGEKVTIKAINVLHSGRKSIPATGIYYRQIMKNAVQKKEKAILGLNGSLYSNELYKEVFLTKELDGMRPWQNFQSYTIDVYDKLKAPNKYGLIYDGYINVPQTGVYTFFLNSDDGSSFWVDNEEVISNEGLHAPEEKAGQISLEKGFHFIKVKYFQGGGGSKLELSWQQEGGKKEVVAPDFLFH